MHDRMKMISSVSVLFIFLPYMKTMDMIFSPVNGRNQIGALHADSHRSHLHVIEFQLNMRLLLCLEVFCVSAAVHQWGDKHRWRGMGIRAPMRVYTCLPTQTRMWLMFQKSLSSFSGGVSEVIIRLLNHAFYIAARIDSRLLIHFRGGSVSLFIHFSTPTY